MSGEQQLSGPDLAPGAPGVLASDLADGAPLLGHAGGEPVLLVRQGSEVFAVAAHCTHYGGPLAEGLVVGHTVRCPWHHACFDLRSGEPLRAPALNPLARYRVEEREGRIHVGEKLPPAPPRHEPGGPPTVLIVGAGAAGNAAAERLRREGYTGPITLLGGDDPLPYDRPNLSKDYLAGNAPEEWIPLHPREFYDDQMIDLMPGSRVVAIEPKAKSVTLADGARMFYGALLLATGAEPVRLDIPGAELPHVRYLRTLADSRAIVERAKKARHAVVLGASFIALEVAAALRTRGVAVTVVAPEDRPLAKVMGPELGDFLRALHEEHGVSFRLGNKARSIGEDTIELASGERLAADLVVAGIGVRPAVALAEAAGLAVDRGVLVNEYLETSAPDIYAAGDIARWPDPYSGERIRVEHWVVAERQGQTAAANLLGRRERFSAVPFFWSQHYDVVINYLGHAESWDLIGVAGSIRDKNATVTFRKHGKILAVATLFRDRDSLEAEQAMEHDTEAALANIVSRR
ncbi:MAG TPA: FAD-dependent oxidoreductase [Thermoanaerobaculia bacterium]|nr:FAD-dependent oxidoreductase [Thermoanaerobaculia bacterium]